MATLDTLVDATPSSRDRSIDFLRALSIVMVVLGHWLIATLSWKDGVLKAGSILSTPGIWLGTWVFQVMPIFFFVGGFANAVAYRSARVAGRSATSFVRSRIDRLLRPSLVFLGVWTIVQVVLHLADIGRPTGFVLWGDTTLLRGFLPPGQTLPFGPIWFLGVYLVVVAISPLTVRLSDRFGWKVPVALAAGAFIVDGVAFGAGMPGLRWANVAFILLFPHQLGHLHADGRFHERMRGVFAAMIAVGLAGLVVLTNPWFWDAVAPQARFDWFPGLGRYPRSLLGTGTEPISNAYPPTLPYLFVGIWTIGLAMLVKPALRRWLENRGPWRFTVATNGIIMTLFLWHMTAYLLAILVLWPFGWGREQTASARWWLEKPVWIGLSAAFLGLIVAVFQRFERPRPRQPG